MVPGRRKTRTRNPPVGSIWTQNERKCHDMKWNCTSFNVSKHEKTKYKHDNEQTLGFRVSPRPPHRNGCSDIDAFTLQTVHRGSGFAGALVAAAVGCDGRDRGGGKEEKTFVRQRNGMSRLRTRMRRKTTLRPSLTPGCTFMLRSCQEHKRCR